MKLSLPLSGTYVLGRDGVMRNSSTPTMMQIGLLSCTVHVVLVTFPNGISLRDSGSHERRLRVYL